MTYLWLKALHVSAAVAFVGGMLAEAVCLAVLTSAGTASCVQARMAGVVRRWDRGMTTPAMLLVWALGLALAVDGGWFPSRWLRVKLVFAVAGLPRPLYPSARPVRPSQRPWAARRFRKAEIG